jgi:hypothetical protein
MLIEALAFAFLVQAQGDPKPQEDPPTQEKKVPAEGKKAQEKQDPESPSEEPSPVHVVAGIRGGAWTLPVFDVMTPAGRRRIDPSLLFDAGVDLGGEYEGWTLGLSGDYGSGKQLRILSGGVLFGPTWVFDDDPLPFELRLSAGPSFGRLEVQESDFGNFKSAVGFEARLSAVSWLSRRLGLSLWADYRQMSFKYDGTILSGDSSAGGSMFAMGVGLLMRF